MVIVLLNLMSLKPEKSAKRTLSPGRNQAEYQAQISTTDYIWDSLHGNSTKTSSSDEVLHENGRNVFLKTCINFGRCYGNKGWAEVVQKYVLIEISSFKL